MDRGAVFAPVPSLTMLGKMQEHVHATLACASDGTPRHPAYSHFPKTSDTEKLFTDKNMSQELPLWGWLPQTQFAGGFSWKDPIEHPCPGFLDLTLLFLFFLVGWGLGGGCLGYCRHQNMIVTRNDCQTSRKPWAHFFLFFGRCVSEVRPKRVTRIFPV